MLCRLRHVDSWLELGTGLICDQPVDGIFKIRTPRRTGIQRTDDSNISPRTQHYPIRHPY